MLESIIKPPLFCYATTVKTIAAGASTTPEINIGNSADFLIYELRAVVYKAAAVTGDLLLQVSLADSDLFSNVGLDIFSFASCNQSNNSGYPIRLSSPIRIPANSSLNIQLTNNNAESLDVQVQLWGIKVTSLSL